jgi:hypothetical protein
MKLNPGFRSLALLAPPHARIPGSFTSVRHDPSWHGSLLRQLQTLRGSVYLEDGAIDPPHLVNGRHIVKSDATSWHLVVLDEAQQVCGCTRYHHHPDGVEFSRLTAAESSLASSPEWGDKMRTAVEEELALSRRMDLAFVEIGGWALAHEIRGSVEALRMVLAAYAFFRTLGGAVGLATATIRHSSASILRRIGGRPLQHNGLQVPSYRDSQYSCSMEMLRFYSWAPNPRYDWWIREIGSEIRSIPVITAAMSEPAWLPMHKSDRMNKSDNQYTNSPALTVLSAAGLCQAGT